LNFENLDQRIYEDTKKWVALNELLHNGSLLQDDILDKANLRRSRPAVHVVHGKWASALAPIFMIGRAGQLMYNIGKPALYKYYSNIIIDLTSGEHAQKMIKTEISTGAIQKVFELYL
jgi:geranylgeranyl pyrophosphate synthase